MKINEKEVKDFYEENNDILIEKLENAVCIENEAENIYIKHIKENQSILNEKDYKRVIEICKELSEISKRNNSNIIDLKILGNNVDINTLIFINDTL